MSDVKGFTKGADSEYTSECKTRTDNAINRSGITLKEKANDPPIDENKKDHAAETASTSPKRRKVLKTRIDERGREGRVKLYPMKHVMHCSVMLISFT